MVRLMKSSMFGLGLRRWAKATSVSTPSKSHAKLLLALVIKYVQIHERELE